MQIVASNVEATQDMVIEGYALLFNNLSDEIRDGATITNEAGEKKKVTYREIISPSALNGLDVSDVKCLVNHDFGEVIGRTKAETLELDIDEKGLHFKCYLPNTSYARDIYENIKVGNIDQCSFRCIFPKKNGYSWSTQNGEHIRTIRNVESLIEVSVVTIPSYKDSSVEISQRSKMFEELEEIEKINIALDLESFRLQI